MLQGPEEQRDRKKKMPSKIKLNFKDYFEGKNKTMLDIRDKCEQHNLCQFPRKFLHQTRW